MKKIIMILMVVLFSVSVYGLACTVDTDCDSLESFTCEGIRKVAYDYNCELGECVLDVVNRSCSVGRLKTCDSGNLYKKVWTCDPTIGCTNTKEFVKDCNDGDYTYCDGHYYYKHDAFCGGDRCRSHTEELDNCGRTRSQCQDGEVWRTLALCSDTTGCYTEKEFVTDCNDRDYNYCSGDVYFLSDTFCGGDRCRTRQKAVEDCTEPSYECRADEVWSMAGECTVSGCVDDGVKVEDCTDNDYWTRGGDTPGYGADDACVGTLHTCSAGSCIGSSVDVDYDHMDNPFVCYDVRSGKKDYYCDISNCNGDCPSGNQDYVNGCSLICGAGCEEDGDCVQSCDTYDGCYDNIHRDYQDVFGSCEDCSCVDSACNDYVLEVDADSDGYSVSCGDCDDNNASINPSMFDIPGNAVDEDCDGFNLCGSDLIWKNHGWYVKCVAFEAQKLVKSGLISGKEKGKIVSFCAESDVGK